MDIKKRLKTSNKTLCQLISLIDKHLSKCVVSSWPRNTTFRGLILKCVSDSPHNPRMHQHPAQEGPKVNQVSQYSQAVRQSEVNCLLNCEFYTMYALRFWLKSVTLALSVRSGACRSRWTVFHPLFDWNPSFFIRGDDGQCMWAPPLSPCNRCISTATEVGACLLLAGHEGVDLVLLHVWFTTILTSQQCSCRGFGSSSRWASM